MNVDFPLPSASTARKCCASFMVEFLTQSVSDIKKLIGLSAAYKELNKAGIKPDSPKGFLNLLAVMDGGKCDNESWKNRFYWYHLSYSVVTDEHELITNLHCTLTNNLVMGDIAILSGTLVQWLETIERLRRLEYLTFTTTKLTRLFTDLGITI